jgi:peptidyl-prolyl cis-trans isomerase D
MLRFLRSGGKHTKLIWWLLTIITIFTFVILFGTGIDQTSQMRRPDSVGSVNGHAISQAEYQAALEDQRANYRRQYGTDPADRDARMVELQAWRGLVAQYLVSRLAKAEGLKAYDQEVAWSLKTTPPPMLAQNAAFQTNGTFDVNKYEAALRNPANNWSAFEDMARRSLPTRKLEQRMLASIKLSEPELAEEFRYRFERLNATLLVVPPSNDPKMPPPSAADLQRAYEENKSRFVAGLRVQLELAIVPRKYTDEDIRTAKQTAQSLVDRARRGEDFAQLARDYSEGAGADRGGVIDRTLQTPEFGVMGQHMETLQPGGISDAFQDGGRFLIFKLLARVPAGAGTPGGMKVAQIVVKAHANEDAVRQQYETLLKLRARAARIGLGKAAAEKGMGTAKTRFFDQSGPPEELFAAPEVADWGMREKVGQVSPVFDGLDEFLIAEVAGRHEAGPASRDELAEPLRQLADMDLRILRAKPRADSIATAIAQGATLEQLARALGLATSPAAGMTRSTPAPQIAGAPEFVGALFAAPLGKVVGPVRGFGGWYFGRVEQRGIADTTTFEKSKGQLSSDLLTRRQQSFFNNFVNNLLAGAKVQDQRYGITR